MGQESEYDVFLSHSAKDKAVVRPLGERLRQDGLNVWFAEWVLKPGDSIAAKIEEGLEHSCVLVLCMSDPAFEADWAHLEDHAFWFHDPLGRECRYIALRLDETVAASASLTLQDKKTSNHGQERRNTAGRYN